MAEQYSIVYMYHIFFIRSFVGEHLSCFQVLAVVNAAAMNIRVNVSFLTIVLSGYMPGAGLLDHVFFLLLVFEELPDCFP